MKAEEKLLQKEKEIKEIAETLEFFKRFNEGGFDSCTINKAMANTISKSLYDDWCAKKAEYDAIKNALDCGSEDGNLESHSEEKIFSSCIQIMQQMMESFKEWLDWNGYLNELDEEELFTYNISVKELVSHLFLWCTHHSGGTSSRAKCRQLGLDPWDEIVFTLKEESEDESHDDR